jgi:hypothetical protein
MTFAAMSRPFHGVIVVVMFQAVSYAILQCHGHSKTFVDMHRSPHMVVVVVVVVVPLTRPLHIY